MNALIDSSAWVSFFAKGPLADKVAKYVENANPKNHFTPTVVLYEVYKKIKKTFDDQTAADNVAKIVAWTTIVDLTQELSLLAADKSLETGLGMADAIVLVTAEKKRATLITADNDFRGQSNVVLIE
ncbi:MAG TPA: type II toxin-antitoxin system VapC family toxin [Candidatus Diapherotrites archaeon]|uniref:Ribonuclease VapC n=1 Tax=Candidatus Iainarchaeum sp. TaxID=3101447 RepID=A0A7J4JFA3_9ARCH|nr:type II toxin-antitoxin system VapC family toxin [Candidatus Diapherotrites archaeon]HIH15800.1 type II toxin-antitoxin system VapC family toxin [Candidatus Diapherotrites archaeon]